VDLSGLIHSDSTRASSVAIDPRPLFMYYGLAFLRSEKKTRRHHLHCQTSAGGAFLTLVSHSAADSSHGERDRSIDWLMFETQYWVDPSATVDPFPLAVSPSLRCAWFTPQHQGRSQMQRRNAFCTYYSPQAGRLQQLFIQFYIRQGSYVFGFCLSMLLSPLIFVHLFFGFRVVLNPVISFGKQ